MKLQKNTATCLFLFLMVFACCTQETEALRRVLRGRRTLTRNYFNGLAIPGWSLAVILGISELIIGVVIYIVMHKVILSKEVEPTNTYIPAPASEV